MRLPHKRVKTQDEQVGKAQGQAAEQRAAEPVEQGVAPAQRQREAGCRAGVWAKNSVNPRPRWIGATYYDIQTTATFEREVNVCITADATTFSNPASLRLLHFVNANWEDITRSVDSATQTVCGVTTSLSPFVVVEPVSSVDTTPPVLSNVPADRTVTATGPDGAVVTYALPTATDGVDGPLPVTCAPASGTTFRIGTTRVTCTATDAAGNSASASFNVTVTGLQSAVTVRLVSSTGAGLPGGSVEYFARGWQPLGSTGADGSLETSLAPSPGNTRFRITYASGRAVVVQNTAENPVVIFTTVSVTVELRDSSGNALNAEHVEFHAGAWEPFGSGLTPATGQLLPGTCTCSQFSWERGHLARGDATRAGRPRSQARMLPQV